MVAAVVDRVVAHQVAGVVVHMSFVFAAVVSCYFCRQGSKMQTCNLVGRLCFFSHFVINVRKMSFVAVDLEVGLLRQVQQEMWPEL